LQEGEAVPTPLEFLLINCYHSTDFYRITLEAFDFFLRLPVYLNYEHKQIVVGASEEDLMSELAEDLITIGEEDYFDFQNAIREACGDKPQKPPEPIDPDEDPRVTEIKMRARERDRIKARRASKDGISMETCLVAICCMGIGITPLNIGEMSYAAIGPIMKMS
jgi:hypothetical protein